MEKCGVEMWNHFNSTTIICGDAGSRRQWHHLGVCVPVQQQKSNAFCFQALIIKYMNSSQGFENFTPNTNLGKYMLHRRMNLDLFTIGFMTASLFKLNQHIG